MWFLEQTNTKLNQLLAVIAGGALIMMMLVTVGNMIIRVVYVPFGATSEVVGWLAAITTGFALGYAQINRAHVTIDLVIDRFPKRWQSLVQALVMLLSIAFFILITWQVFLYGERLRGLGVLSETLRFPHFYFVYALVIGFACLTLVLMVDFLKSLLGVVNK
ncbi:MAG: TRAP transporter small permease [Clostridia bacterium]|nr:TRAP transporter small permease [Clostridia bacterium]